MIRTIALIALILAAAGLVAGIYLQVTDITGRVDELADMSLDQVSIKTTWLDDVNLTALLPLMQVFMGQAIDFETIELPQATQTAVTGLNLTLPSGWEIAKDAAGQNKAYQTTTSTVVMVEDKRGNFAIISATQVADPAAFLSDMMNQQANLLKTSGFAVNAYTTTMANGQEAKAIDLVQGGMAIETRGWISGNKVYIITLSSDADDLPVTEQVFGSIS